ncbi:pyruvate kinase [Bacillus pseudomycoides]|uniref:pyruvate kinase n=1 Tax=Bacillus TaxID=1386 RepID=UPI0005582FF1
MRKTKIVCTIGPACEQYETLLSLLKSGMNVARLNFSHGTHEEHQVRINTIRKAATASQNNIALLQDIKGPKIRTDEFEGGQAELREEETVIVSMKKVLGTSQRFSVTYEGLYDDVEIGSHLLLDDGLLELEVTKKDNGELQTKVIHGGIIKDHKGVNVPNVKIRLPGITEKDKQDILFGIGQQVDYIAVSFVRKATDILEVRDILAAYNASHIRIIAKIENQEGIENIKEIVEVTDGIMVARGDMGIEIPAEYVPIIQKQLIHTCNTLGKPVITATQMLDSMQRNPRPTRAEASDVANAIFDGTDAIMLSGETAAGEYPVEAVQMMDKIALQVEESSLFQNQKQSLHNDHKQITETIGAAAVQAAYSLQAKAILTPTKSGYTAQMISKYRPNTPIIATTSEQSVMQQLALVWGIYPLFTPQKQTTDEVIEQAISKAKERQLVSMQDIIIVTAGVPVNERGTTNLLKIEVVK